jgi:hypothetical protein
LKWISAAIRRSEQKPIDVLSLDSGNVIEASFSRFLDDIYQTGRPASPLTHAAANDADLSFTHDVFSLV